MKNFYFRLLRLILGLFLYALGIVLTINAHIGYAPWDVFHVGISKTLGFSIGTASILTGIIIVLISTILGEKFGLGTILNILLIGIFVDMILISNIIPISKSLFLGILTMILGLFIISLASYFYIGSGFGAGPRDSLMVSITRKTGLPIGICRGIIEFLAILVGWKLGGMLGIGTIIFAFTIGITVQTTFKLLKFDATKVNHESFSTTLKMFLVKKNG